MGSYLSDEPSSPDSSSATTLTKQKRRVYDLFPDKIKALREQHQMDAWNTEMYEYVFFALKSLANNGLFLTSNAMVCTAGTLHDLENPNNNLYTGIPRTIPILQCLLGEDLIMPPKLKQIWRGYTTSAMSKRISMNIHNNEWICANLLR